MHQYSQYQSKSLPYHLILTTEHNVAISQHSIFVFETLHLQLKLFVFLFSEFFSSYDIIFKIISGSKTKELLLLFVFPRLCSFLGLLISGVDDDGKGNFLKVSKTDS